MNDPTLWTFMTAEHTDTYTTDFATIEYTDTHTTDFATTEHTETVEFVTSEHTEALEFATSEQTDTHGQESGTTAPSSNTETETESREVASESVCFANSVIITVCTLLSLTFLFGVICGLIADRCVCALLKRKAKQQNKVSLQNERIDKTTHHYEMGANEEASADIYDEITPDCKPGIANTRMELNY